MKKYLLPLLLLLLLSISGCTTNDSATPTTQNPDPTFHMKKEGIEPFAFTEREDFLLNAFSMKQNIALFTCKLPKEIVSMQLFVHTLQKDGTWDSKSVMGISRSLEDDFYFNGSIAILFQEDNSIQVTAPGGSTVIASPNLTFPVGASCRTQLTEYKEVVPNQEIPLVFTVKDSGSSMYACSIDDYFNPEKFRDMDFVQAITVVFRDKIDEPNE